ncbi:MAG: LysR family transcriptional regulator [Polaromonas sp.]|uniref:LysR family transcriptional regulator n=1 Tax=Polaromonas sp. TaxID=1869339 RepID=UPI0025F2BB0E|nr:LysR family transcriptional regulator [Polaromonas sp.]MBI2726504.1 LysR family transcriptional regulator [Polaromonas sp.]
MDIKLLKIFEAIFRTGNLSRVADEFDCSQPAISIALGRLREHFGDPLFVRTSSGMQATPYALSVMPMVSDALKLLVFATSNNLKFNPAESQREFRIALTDTGQVVFIPRLLAAIKKVAPGVTVRVSTISEKTEAELESGSVDIALGVMLTSLSGMCQQRLFKETFACLVSNEHPRIGKTVDREQFLNEAHVSIYSSGSGQAMIEEYLSSIHAARKVTLHLPNFMSLPSLITNTDLVATLPRRPAEIMAKGGALRLVEPLISFPTYVIRQLWHERYARDPGNIWLRSMIFGLELSKEDLPEINRSK